MVSVCDVAAYILRHTGRITAMKLQKLVYYSQAWSLVWDEAPLFGERIEAWANGPVSPDLYAVHRRLFEVVERDIPGDPMKLTDMQRETVDSVLSFYGTKSSQWLSDLTHMEDPWRQARNGAREGERGNEEITLASMHEYYSSIQPD